MKTLLICLLLISTSCGNRSPRPVEIEASDIYAQCKMAISEQRYAAEMADLDGNVMKFDNIDCMIRYAAAHGMKDKAGAWFVMDSDGREWLDARQAFLVKSASIPGSYGKRGFGDQRFRGGQGTRSPVLGEVLRLEDLWKQ